ncbi:unnamed protein product, partial [Notodromas monacha]
SSNGTCGIQAIRQDRIVGGIEATPGEFPFLVGIASVFRPRHFCGGSLINEFWVLTAAHCVNEHTGSDASQLRVRIREFDLDHDEDPPSYQVKVEKVYYPEEFDFDDGFSNDIALLRLTERISWDNYTVPVCLPDANDTFDFELAVAAGWGRLAEMQEKTPSKLRKVTLHVIPADFCMEWTEYEMTDHQFCAGFKHKARDVCSGDSGGPLLVRRDGRHVAIGVVSYGDGCARPRTPTVYTDLAKFGDWIRQIMEGISWDNYTVPVCLPDANDTFDFELAVAAGWGRLAEMQEKTPSKLRKVTLHVIPADFCMEWTEYEMTDHQFCAGFKHKARDVCSGDSGGPLLVRRDGRHVAIGVVSYGDGCARPRTPTVYTDLAKFGDWIRQIMEGY